jgi:hypothetical protein
MEGRDRGLIVWYYLVICLGDLGKQRKSCQDSWSPGQKSNPGYPEY